MEISEPKKIRFGLSIIQGFAAGTLGGFIYMVLSFSQGNGKNLDSALSLLPYFLLTFAILGCIEATIIWSIYRLMGRTLRARARVSVTTMLSTLLVAFTGLYFELNEEQITNFLLLTLSLGMPVALMVGSTVKPWELFTFGSIAAGEVDHRVGSRNILATIGSLPLRFLGIGTTALFLLSLISEIQPMNNANKIVGAFLSVSIVCVYPMFSAFVTFRSPCKIVLTTLGFLLNIPIALIGLFCYGLYDKAYWLGNFPVVISAFCGSFVVAWVIFLIARLSVNTGELSEAVSRVAGERT